MSIAPVGYHTRKVKSIHNSIMLGMNTGANALQFFICAPMNSYPPEPLSEAEAAKINQIKREEGLYTVVHGKYMYNFCRDKDWQVKSLAAEMRVGNQIGSDVVIHQGKNVAELKLNKVEALKAFAKNVSVVLKETSECKNRILLENSCQQGNECGFTLDELAEIYSLFSSADQKRIGFCIDLCHIFVAGSLDVRDPVAVQDFFKEFEEKIGLKKLKLIHFNDSNMRFDAHNDNHNDLLVGYIGNTEIGGNSAGFKTLSKIAAEHEIPMVLETPGKTEMADQILLIRSWIADMDEIESDYITKYSEQRLAIKEKSKSKARQSVVSKQKEKPLVKPLASPKITITPLKIKKNS